VLYYITLYIVNISIYIYIIICIHEYFKNKISIYTHVRVLIFSCQLHSSYYQNYHIVILSCEKTCNFFFLSYNISTTCKAQIFYWYWRRLCVCICITYNYWIICTVYETLVICQDRWKDVWQLLSNVYFCACKIQTNFHSLQFISFQFIT